MPSNSAEPFVFDLDYMFLLFFMVVVGGCGRHDGAVIGAVVLFALPELLGGLIGKRHMFFYGLLVVLRRSCSGRTDLAGIVDRVRARAWRPKEPRRLERTARRRLVRAEVACAVRRVAAVPLLTVRDLERALWRDHRRRWKSISSFMPARSRASSARTSGTSKTTTFDLIAGAFPPTAGSARCTKMPRIRYLRRMTVAAHGIMRSLSAEPALRRPGLCDNVLIGVAYALSRQPDRLASSRPRRGGTARGGNGGSCRSSGSSRQADEDVRRLSYGQGRLLEVARAMMGGPSHHHARRACRRACAGRARADRRDHALDRRSAASPCC